MHFASRQQKLLVVTAAPDIEVTAAPDIEVTAAPDIVVTAAPGRVAFNVEVTVSPMAICTFRIPAAEVDSISNLITSSPNGKGCCVTVLAQGHYW